MTPTPEALATKAETLRRIEALERLKPGDEVALEDGSWSITRVEKVTPTGMISVKTIGATYTFRPPDYRIAMKGYSGRPKALHPVTDEIRQTIARDALEVRALSALRNAREAAGSGWGPRWRNPLAKVPAEVLESVAVACDNLLAAMEPKP